MKKDKEKLKARGIRFNDDQWNNLSRDAKKQGTTPSAVNRDIVEAHYQRKK